MKLYNGQDKNNDPSEECGEERTAALEVNSGHSETKNSVKLFNDRDKNNCCPSKHKYLFGIPVDDTIMKFTTGPSTRSSKSDKNRIHRAGTRWLHAQKQPTVRTKETKKLKVMERYAMIREDEDEREEKRVGERRRKE